MAVVDVDDLELILQDEAQQILADEAPWKLDKKTVWQVGQRVNEDGSPKACAEKFPTSPGLGAKSCWGGHAGRFLSASAGCGCRAVNRWTWNMWNWITMCTSIHTHWAEWHVWITTKKIIKTTAHQHIQHATCLYNVYIIIYTICIVTTVYSLTI